MKILIVEDIESVQQGIASLLLNRYETEILTAGNGEKAMELLAQRPQLILTDVKMPICDGVQLLERMKAADIRIPVIVISGYAEFEYAERAINMGARGYILKPIDEQILYQKIDGVLAELVQQEELQEIQLRQSRLENQRYSQWLSAQVTDFLLGKPMSTVTEVWELLSRPVQAWGMLLLLNIDARYYEYTNFSSQDMEIVKYGIINIAQELLEGCDYLIAAHSGQRQQLFLLLQGNDCQALYRYGLHCAETLVEQVGKHLKIAISIAASLTTSHIGPEPYRQARQALQRRLSCGNSGLYCYQPPMDEPAAMPESLFSLFSLYVKKRDSRGALDIVSQIFADTIDSPDLVCYIRQATLRLTEPLTQVFGTRWHGLVDLDFTNEETLSHYCDIAQVRSVVLDMVERIFRIDSGEEDVGSTVQRVRQYLDGHYNENLSVGDLARNFGISYPYLCTQFKQAYGCSIVQHLTLRRMETAASMLQSDRAEIAQIAEQVGYGDLQYFYRMFKKHHGVTPMAYRNRQKIE